MSMAGASYSDVKSLPGPAAAISSLMINGVTSPSLV